MDDMRISLAHGNGGRFMRELIEEVFAKHLHKSELNIQADAVPIDLNGGRDDYYRRVYRSAAGVSGRRHRLAGDSRHDE